MEFRYSTEQELFRKALREHCEANIEPVARSIDDAHNGIPDEILRGLADLGVLGITHPAEYGGSGAEGEEHSYATIAVAEIARADMSMAIPVYVLLQLGWASLVGKHATESLKKRLLPGVASGELFVGIAVTEPGGGSDVANIKTRAEIKGDRLLVNGEKVFISGVRETTEQRDGGHITLVRTDPDAGHKGFTFVYIPARAPGVTPTVFDDIGRGGLSTGGFSYKNVEVPLDNVLGEINGGFYLNMEGFNIARTLVAAACVGAADKALEISMEHTSKRVLFNRPLASFEGISFEIAEDHARLHRMKLLLQQTAWTIDTFYSEPGSFTFHDLNRLVAMCKLEAPLMAVEMVRHSMMHLGALSYTKESPLGMALLGLMSYLVGAEGGANIQKLIIARELMGDVAVPYR